MKTKDFIARLQEEDPSGECHVRLPGGVPRYFEQKQGYYDGAYSYVDEEGHFVISKKGWKVDVGCIDLEDFIWDKKGDVSLLRFEGIDKKNQKGYIAQAEKYAVDYKANREQAVAEWTYRVIKKLKDGWQIVQPAHEPVGRYNVMWFIKDPTKFKEKHDKKKGFKGVRYSDDNQKTMCQGECMAVLKSGLFNHENAGTLIFWELSLV